MQKQIIKGLTMLMLIAAVALMAALVSAHAQSSSSVVADIPFEFSVGGKSMKAGEYSVKEYTANGDAVLIRSQDSEGGAVRLTQSIQAPTPQQGKLVFHRYGQSYFLSEVWMWGQQTGRQLLKSGQERAIENQLATIPSKNERARHSYTTVEIVALVR
jgi:hypothetical protein